MLCFDQITSGYSVQGSIILGQQAVYLYFR